MDPYIEDAFFWADFHGSMMVAFRAALNAVLPERYTASIERNVWVQEVESEETTLVGVPDVQVADRQDGATGGGQATATRAVAAPVTIALPLVRRQAGRFLRITDRHQRRIVTVVELLSPANKTAASYGIAYRQKRADYVAGGINLVEIDLLRAGTRPVLGDPALPPSDYYTMVCSAATFPQAGYWPLSVRDALPLLPIPLGPEDESSSLDVRACMDQVYDAGRYNREIDYSQPAVPPLRDPDAAWARQLLAQAGH
jgi:hypothetical protein